VTTTTDTIRTPQPTPAKAVGRRRRVGEVKWAVIFLTPALAALLLLRIAPAIDAIKTSVYRGFPGGIIPDTFAGLANYRLLFGDPNFLDTIVRTLVFNLVINPLQIFLALLLAVLMVQRIPLAGVWRTLVFIPVTIPIVGSSIAWSAALNPRGPVNALISALGGDPQPFFTSPGQSVASIITVASWIGIGYWMLFLIAGLGAVPQELYEASRVDGAGAIRTFFSITIPMLKRPLLFVLVADTVANFVLFVPIQLLTNGGPQSSTTQLMFDAYRTTFAYGSRNTGAAETVILTVIMLAFVLLQFRLLREKEA
jgi:multiple sugar transport system permease protein